MTMKLIQKSFLNGTQEFELLDDIVNVRIKKFFKEEKLTVGLAILNPEAVLNGPYLEFHDRYKDHLLLSLRVNKPNANEFNAFINALIQKVSGQDNTHEEVETVSSESARREALARNIYEEPPEFWEPDRDTIHFKPVNAERLGDDIIMLKTYLNENDIKPLLNTLETLKAEPKNQEAFQKMADAYNDLGILAGAVLTYAPYLKALLSESLAHK